MPLPRQNDGHHGNNLHQHLEFSQFAGLNREAFRRCDGTQPAHQKFAADDDDRHPCRHQRWIELHQSDEGSRDQKFVGQRIEQHPHGRDLPALAREVSVDAIGHGGEDKDGRGQNFALSGSIRKPGVQRIQISKGIAAIRVSVM